MLSHPPPPQKKYKTQPYQLNKLEYIALIGNKFRKLGSIQFPHTITVDHPTDQSGVDCLPISLLLYQFQNSVSHLFVQWPE